MASRLCRPCISIKPFPINVSHSHKPHTHKLHIFGQSPTSYHQPHVEPPTRTVYRSHKCDRSINKIYVRECTPGVRQARNIERKQHMRHGENANNTTRTASAREQTSTTLPQNKSEATKAQWRSKSQRESTESWSGAYAKTRRVLHPTSLTETTTTSPHYRSSSKGNSNRDDQSGKYPCDLVGLTHSGTFCMKTSCVVSIEPFSLECSERNTDFDIGLMVAESKLLSFMEEEGVHVICRKCRVRSRLEGRA